jgi:FAD/FMN-containing dehydrogenase
MSATLGLDPARALDPAGFAVGGAVPRVALRPATREEAAAALAAATRDRLAVVPWGGGVGLARAGVPPRYDAALDLTALDRIVVHEPDDFTVTVECGITVGALRAALAVRGQTLPLEAPREGRATLGGALAAAASGARRLRIGGAHDRLLGAAFALTDGTLVRTGGRVVKNVAGHAVHRLLCGSRGGLAVLVEASLKLAPAPEARTALAWDADAGTLADAARWAGVPRLEPAALTVLGRAAAAAAGLGGGTPFTVVVGLEDDAAWVERQCDALRAALGVERARLDGAAVAALWPALADLEDRDGPHLAFGTAANTPDALAPLAAEPEAAHAVFHAPAGRLHVFPAGAARAPVLARTLGAAGFTLLGSRGAGEVPPTLPRQQALDPLRERLREALDPARTLAFGDAWLAR